MNTGVQRRLAAILAADVVGYSRLMEADEAGTHARLKALRAQFMEPTISEHHGRIVKLTGDGALVEFASVVDAVQCALAIQRGVTEREAKAPGGQRVRFRIGVNLGDIIIEDEDIYGGGVNVAARLESLAEPGGILISGTAYDHVEGKLDCGFKYLGEKEVKNIERPVRAYRVLLDQGVGSPSAMPIVGGGRHWWSGAGVAAAILVLLGTADWLQPWQNLERAAVGLGSEASALNPRRLAVLPFADISADAENEYFSDGLTEELISQLSRIRELSVIARTSVIGYKGTDKRIDEIGRELDAGTILEGSVRKAGNQVRITVQLIDTASQAHLWSEDYSRQFEDIFAIQAEIAKHVADTLKVTLLASTRDQISRQPTESLEAYNFYLRGRYFLNQYTKEGLHKAMEYFEQALVKDPKFALAHAGISHALNQMFWNGGMRANEAYPRAKAAAQRALALDETTADAWTALALAELDFYWNWEAAEGALKQALALNQSDAVAHELYGHRLLSAVQGRYDEAIAEMKRALELNPLSLGANHRLGMVLMHARQLESAIEQLDKAVELGPNFIWPHLGLAYCYAAKGMYEDAISETQKTVQITGRSAFTLGQLAWAYGVAGNKEKAMDILHELEKIRKRNSVDPAAFAYLYLGLDDKDQALYWLQKMYEERSPEMLYLRATPSWDRLRTDPRFAELIKNVGLEPVAN